MRVQWLNLVLRLSNRIFRKKQVLVGQEGMTMVRSIISLVVSEFVLAMVSLPLYMGLKTQTVSAFLQEKGEYDQVTFDYKLRRILTLTSAFMLLVVGIIKLLVIFLVPRFFGPLQLYQVVDLRPPDIEAFEQQLIAEDTGIQTAQLVQSLERPELKGVERKKGKNFRFYGVGQPDTTIVLFVTDQQTAIYTDQVDQDGNWQVDHSQEAFSLAEGNHSVLAFTYNKDAGTRSDFSDVQYFKVKTTWLDIAVRNVDTIVNGAIIGVVLLGIFLIFITI